MSFAAAILRETCTFQARSEVGDGGGGIEVSWTDRFVRRGAIAFANLSAQLESIQQGELSSRTRATVTVREDPETRTITPDWRVRIAQGGYTSDVWNIRDVIRPEPGWLRMVVEKGVPV